MIRDRDMTALQFVNRLLWLSPPTGWNTHEHLRARQRELWLEQKASEARTVRVLPPLYDWQKNGDL